MRSITLLILLYTVIFACSHLPPYDVEELLECNNIYFELKPQVIETKFIMCMDIITQQYCTPVAKSHLLFECMTVVGRECAIYIQETNDLFRNELKALGCEWGYLEERR